MYWCARCSISGRVVGGRSISDQKNLDGLSPVKNAWMARDGWRSGIPWTCDVNRPTNWERGSSLPWAIPRREAVVGLGRALAKKFSSNSLVSKSNEGIDAGLRREYQVLADPLRVVGKARHISASEVSSDFAIRLASGSGKLRRLRRLEAVAPLRRARFPGLGLLVTPYEIMVCTIPASAWTWLVRSRKASVVTMNDAGLDAGEGNPGSVIILQKRLGVGTATVASSVGRGCSARWMVPQGSAHEVSCWNGGARVGRKYSNSGRSLTPARRSGRVGSRHDPSDGPVSLVLCFPILMPRRGAGAYIVGVVDHPYLTTWLPLWPTMPSYTSTTPAVLAVRDASTGKGISLTCVRSIVRPLGIRPYPCQVDRMTTGAPIPASDQLPASGRPHRRTNCPEKR
ncbi:hypothetical protein GW17_00007374 [Ensete ventricosum]|nr:hypothetical protein GW17_00007374 [Ensete ventricosum]